MTYRTCVSGGWKCASVCVLDAKSRNDFVKQIQDQLNVDQRRSPPHHKHVMAHQ